MIAFDPNTWLMYEGLSNYGHGVSPAPVVSVATFVRRKQTGAVCLPVVPCGMRRVCSVKTTLTLSAGFGGAGSTRWQGVLSLTTGAFTSTLLLLKRLVIRIQMAGSENP